MTRLRFEWDPRKAAANLKKHGVAFEEARTIFIRLISARKANARERAQYEEKRTR